MGQVIYMVIFHIFRGECNEGFTNRIIEKRDWIDQYGRDRSEEVSRFLNSGRLDYFDLFRKGIVFSVIN